MARPNKYSQDVVKRLLHAIELGATYELACKYAGISYQTFNEWRSGRQFPKGTTDVEKREFSEALEKAEGRAVIGWLNHIEQSAADGQWQPAAWKLERRYPQDYGKTIQEQHHTGKDGQPLTVRFEVVSPRAALAEQSE